MESNSEINRIKVVRFAKNINFDSMKRLISLFTFLLMGLISIAQTPQNVSPGKGKGESIWDSTTTIVLIVVFILLMIISRTWSKRVHSKRDEISNENKKKEEEKTENES